MNYFNFVLKYEVIYHHPILISLLVSHNSDDPLPNLSVYASQKLLDFIIRRSIVFVFTPTRVMIPQIKNGLVDLQSLSLIDLLL